MLNISTIQGRLSKDVELKQTQTGKFVASFRIASDRDFGEGTDWIDCVAWEKTADFIAKYFRKGSLILVNGRMQSRSYDTKNGEHRTAIELNVNNAYFCESKKDSKPDVGIDLISDDDLKDIPVEEPVRTVYPAKEMTEEERIMYEDEHLPF